jgi:CO/xanthine dehydrogenase FAD-binding subunit
VKASRFDYVAPDGVGEALGLLASAPDEAVVLAGGQSLVPMLNMRLARPALLVDLNKIDALSGIRREDGILRVGAMTRQRALELDPLARQVPLLSAAARHIAHVPIRTRGTVGGSLAHADPAAELPATVAALDGRILLRSARGARSVEAGEFFVGPLMTTREPDEILEAVEIPVPPEGAGWAFREVTRTHGAFALAGVAVVTELHDDGTIARARMAVLGVGGRPYLPDWLDEFAVGEQPDERLFAEVGGRVRESLPAGEDGDYRRQVAGALTVRTMRHAVARAAGSRDHGR